MSPFAEAVFAISAEKLSDLPAAGGAEIVFAGRSNAGKSSVINTLTGKARLAFVSKTPGRTQLINFFRLRNGAFLVDLPGYGHAEVPYALRRRWQDVLATYLRQRISICGLVLVMDARRPLTDLDRRMIEWFVPTGKPIHVLLTKADKLTRSEAIQTLRATRSALAPWADRVSVQLFSSLKKTGTEEAESIIGGWLGDGRKKPPAKGEKNRGQKRLNLIKAPAQGGKAGDGSTPSANSERESFVKVPVETN
jgi:GTP-binding protein